MDMSKEKNNLAPEQVAAIEGSVQYHIDPEDDQKVLKKIDWVVMPVMMLVLFFQCKTLLAYNSCLNNRTYKNEPRS
jgi:hypothetical protein